MNYYFLVSSLPQLQFGLKPPIDLKSFLSVCEANLLAGDLAVMRDLLATGGAHSDAPFVREWRDQDAELRNEVARLRSRNRPLGHDSWLRPQHGVHVYIQTAVTEAFQAKDPLERERGLDRLRWAILEELAGLNPFSIDALFSYALRLRLVCRWAAFQAESGLTLLEQTASVAAKSSGQRISGYNPQKAISA